MTGKQPHNRPKFTFTWLAVNAVATGRLIRMLAIPGEANVADAIIWAGLGALSAHELMKIYREYKNNHNGR